LHPHILPDARPPMRKEFLAAALTHDAANSSHNAEGAQNSVSTNCEPDERTVELKPPTCTILCQ